MKHGEFRPERKEILRILTHSKMIGIHGYIRKADAVHSKYKFTSAKLPISFYEMIM